MLGLFFSMCIAGSSASQTPTADPRPLHVVRMTSKKDASLECSAFFPDGKTVVFGGGYWMGPGELLFWDVEKAKVKHAHTEHKLAITCVTVSPDGKRLATGGGFGEVKVWDQSGKVIASLDGLAEYTYAVLFSPDGKWLVHCGGKFVVRETGGFKVVDDLGKPKDFAMPGSFSPDGKMLVGHRADGELRFLTVPEWKESIYHSKIHGQRYFKSLYSPDGKTLAAHTAVDVKEKKKRTSLYTVEAWSISGSELGKKRFEVAGHYLGQAFTPDGKYLLLGEMTLTQNCRIRVWEVATGREKVSWIASKENVRHLSISPDGKLLVSCDGENLGKVWNLKAILEDK